ncbi:alpha/beta fold hydrolase [Micromonospora sp. WMMD1082]|uniref:alpha/beta hydrolase n=1 Tax=Micromonospora sp. WMMD1082 TaxID=3016104 RepID=UPI002416B0B4|nr:alpha/beta fold hydrolase [Micromonospora sp. WMMD1082]MDG4798181.1 alpha/beta fold hydrolase [Micromonospora sp. WMMD1082]
MADSSRPDTVVLVHGLWMTPRSWEQWIQHYRSRGLTVLAPGYPGFDIEVEALRRNPDLIANLTVAETVDHLTDVIRQLPRPPIIIGHSFGGTLTQLLLARGLGCAGVAIDSAPTEGVRVTPISQARSLFPALKNPATRHRAVGFTPEEFHYAFTNTLTEAESREVWDRYHIPAPGYWIWEYGLLANLKPGHQDTWVDYAADRAPLLFIAGAEDHIMPPSVNRANARHYDRSPAVTDYHEFPGRDHWTCGAPGWQAVADHALEWALRNARVTRPA